jgi:hypothetical protein
LASANEFLMDGMMSVKVAGLDRLFAWTGLWSISTASGYSRAKTW